MTSSELKNFVFVSIISADNDEFSEAVKQEILTRYNENKENWEYILQPIEDKEIRDRYIKLFNETH